VSTLSTLLNACSSDLVLAHWACKPSSSTGHSDSGSSDGGVSFEFPWSTGFEDGFCGFQQGGLCYTTGPTGAASYKIVDSPVHSGHYAAAFTVIGESDKGTNSRCFRLGALPAEAYYGAWYYIPTLATNSGNWNLYHFLGSLPDGGASQGWDLSLVNNDNGGLRLSVRGYLTNLIVPDMSGAPAIPIGHWFHIVMYLKLAADATGEVDVYQDNERILYAPNLITDTGTSVFDQWYVGNLADGLNPAESTVYVDDVTIEPTL